VDEKTKFLLRGMKKSRSGFYFRIRIKFGTGFHFKTLTKITIKAETSRKLLDADPALSLGVSRLDLPWTRPSWIGLGRN